MGRGLSRFLQDLAGDGLHSLNYLLVLFRLYQSESDLLLTEIFDQPGGHRRNLLERLEDTGWVRRFETVKPSGAPSVCRYRLTGMARRKVKSLAERICPESPKTGLNDWLTETQALGDLSLMRLLILARLTAVPGQQQADLVPRKSGYRRSQLDKLILDDLVLEDVPDTPQGRGRRYYTTERWSEHLLGFAEPPFS